MKPVEDIKRNGSTSVTEMTVVIGCNSTDIHGNLARLFGGEDLLLIGHGIVNPQLNSFLRHGRSLNTNPLQHKS